MALPVILQYNDCQEEFQLVDKRLHIPTVERVFGLWNAKVDGAIQSADERGFTFGTYMPGSMHEITGTAALPGMQALQPVLC